MMLFVLASFNRKTAYFSFMPINRAVLKTRTITAFFYVVAMLAGICWNKHSFKFLLMVILVGCMSELSALLRKKDGRWKPIHLFWAFAYIGIPISLFLRLGIHQNEDGSEIYSMWMPLMVLCSIWINDTMAYLVGSWIGKTPLSRYSPKKTWEGTIGGVILSMLVLIGIAQLVPVEKSILFWALFALIASVFGTIGDLFESRLKRMADVKDSGTLLPGHGGFLDRFDSLLFAAPAIWLLLKLLSSPFFAS
jgi:phosphatidate cytidylyltransferase